MNKNIPIRDKFNNMQEAIAYIKKIKYKKHKNKFKNTDDVTFDISEDGYEFKN